jgi:transposase
MIVMIPKAREVQLKPKVRKVLEARCRAPTAPQRDVKRARIVLLAAAGRSTRSIAAEVGVEPRIVSNWRRRFAEHGLGGLKDRPRAGKKPMYGKATNEPFSCFWISRRLTAMRGGRGRLLAKALSDVDVQYVWRFLREHNIDLAARKSWCESNDPAFAPKAADVVGLYIDTLGFLAGALYLIDHYDVFGVLLHLTALRWSKGATGRPNG